jgi:hypothetical protein
MGMALDRAELDALQAARIRAQARVNPQRQTSGKYVLTCDESGGGNKDIGHYVGFVPLTGSPFIVSRKLVSLGTNAIHRHIVASMLFRFEVFRYRENYIHAFITLHRASENGRGEMTRQALFRGKYGEINKNGVALFPSDDGGEDFSVPSFLEDGFKAAVLGSRCRGTDGNGCLHAGHFESVANVKLPEATLLALRIVIPDSQRTTEATSQSVKLKPKATAAA